MYIKAQSQFVCFKQNYKTVMDKKYGKSLFKHVDQRVNASWKFED